MTDSENHEARHRAHGWFHFLQHLTTFVSVTLVILVIDLVANPGDFFVQWVAAIWGAVLGAHFLNILLFGELLGWRGEHSCGGWRPRRLDRRAGRSE